MLRLPLSVQIRAETIPRVAQSEKKSQTLTLNPSFCLISVTIYNPVCIRRVMTTDKTERTDPAQAAVSLNFIIALSQ